MDIQVDITSDFDKAYKKIPNPKRELIAKKINLLIEKLQAGDRHFLYRPRGIAFPDGVKPKESTLYVFRALPDYRIFLCLDDDPLRRQMVLTLFDIAKHDNVNVCFMSVASKIYK